MHCSRTTKYWKVWFPEGLFAWLRAFYHTYMRKQIQNPTRASTKTSQFSKGQMISFQGEWDDWPHIQCFCTGSHCFFSSPVLQWEKVLSWRIKCLAQLTMFKSRNAFCSNQLSFSQYKLHLQMSLCLPPPQQSALYLCCCDHQQGNLTPGRSELVEKAEHQWGPRRAGRKPEKL